jgi:hypothetical protein
MPKRHHSSHHHEVHHSRADSSYAVDGAYAGRDATKRMEHHDSMMISEDSSAIANLPQNVIMKDWSDHEAYLPEILDDTIVGINKQINYDDKKRAEHFVPKKV